MRLKEEAARVRFEVSGRRVGSDHLASNDFTYSVVAIAPGERRHEGRRRTRLRQGRVAERRGRVLVDCRILDLSRRGARLRLELDRPIPRSFLLMDVASQMDFRATVAWRAGRDVGVRLVALEREERIPF